MKCIIIEDQPPAQRILKKYIEDFGSLELVGTFGDAIKALDFLSHNEIDLIFLDIHLPKLSGMEFIKALQNPPNIILTTAFPNFALESYEFNVVDYLLKPFSFPRFIKAVSKISKNTTSDALSSNQAKPSSIFIKTGYEHIKVNISDILFIKADDDYTEVFLEDAKYLCSETLKDWIENEFLTTMIRVHKSYIVNKTNIKKVSSTAILLESNHEIPIGRAYKENVLKALLP